MLHTLLTHTPLMYFVQSFWRDEAYSVLMAKEPLLFIFKSLGYESPIYYTMLHFWIKIFGSSEIAARSLSFVGFLLTVVVIIEWADVLYKKHWLSWYLPLFFFVNPMLLYHAFEVRTYSWYAFFATLMLYTYSIKNWKWFVVTGVIGLYSHVYLLPFIAALMLHRIWAERHTFLPRILSVRSVYTSLIHDPGIKSFFAIGVLIIPWLIKVGLSFAGTKSSWYFPVDFQLIKSVLGNMFVGYEGTPWYGWKYTSYLSLLIAGSSIFALFHKTHTKRAQVFVFFGAIPLIVVIAVSFFKPIFVNRYLLPVTIVEVLLFTEALASIRKPVIQKIFGALLLIGVLWFNWWFPPQHPKVAIRETFEQINTLVRPDDVILASHPLIFMETLYYAKDPSRAHLYNPDNGVFPWYVGDALAPPTRMVRDLPVYPHRAFLVQPDGSFEVTYRMPL